jgi:hypothetical protein
LNKTLANRCFVGECPRNVSATFSAHDLHPLVSSDQFLLLTRACDGREE